jgi:hypothetical protein
MRRETVTVASDLDEVLEAFRRDEGTPNDFSALVDAALRQYLRARGYVAASDYRPLRLTRTSAAVAAPTSAPSTTVTSTTSTSETGRHGRVRST